MADHYSREQKIIYLEHSIARNKEKLNVCRAKQRKDEAKMQARIKEATATCDKLLQSRFKTEQKLIEWIVIYEGRLAKLKESPV